MGRVEMSVRLGVNCGKCPTVFLLLVATIYFLSAMTYTLTTRLYLRAYYCSAHVAAVAAIVALFVLSHHLLRLKTSLGCSSVCFLLFQVVLNLLYLIACAASAIAYTIVATLTHAHNFDYVAAAVWAWSTCVWLLYLLSLTTVAANPNRHSVATFGHLDAYAPTTTTYVKENGNLDFEMDAKPYAIPAESTFSPRGPQKRCVTECCIGMARFVFGLLYSLTHVLLLVTFFLTAFYPSAVTVDILHTRHSRMLYEVSVNGHRPINLYLTCVGTGNDTIVYENTIGEFALLPGESVPRVLSSKYRVCSHNRRGVGWSDSVESDFIGNVRAARDVSKTDAEYFRSLVSKAGVSVPFVYVGHGYGIRSVIETISSAPDMVKAAVFLDDLQTTDLKLTKSLLEMGANLRGTGILWAAFDLGFLGLGALLNVDELSDHGDAAQAFRSTASMETFVRELQSNRANLDLGKRRLDVPVLSISHSPGSSTLVTVNHTFINVRNFPSNSTLVYSVPQSNLATPSQRSNYTVISSNLIDAFVDFLHAPAHGIRPVDGALNLKLEK